MTLIEDIVQIYLNYGYPTEVLAASIRHPMHVLECAKAGADVAYYAFECNHWTAKTSINRLWIRSIFKRLG